MTESASTATALDPHPIPAHNAAMNAQTLDPLISEFETQEQADSYDVWFRAKVQEAIDNPHPYLPHDAAMAHVDQMIEELRKQRATR